jgi:hypothetical protein
MDRRKFCASSVAAAVSAVAAGSIGPRVAACVPAAARERPVRERPAMPDASAPSVDLYKFIYDDRDPTAREFGLAARGVADAVAIRGDVTALWSRGLHGEWSAGRGAIAGMTSARSAFCLEQLARDHWMRMFIRIDHIMEPGSEAAHRLTAPESMLARMASTLAAPDWPAQLPSALAICPSCRAGSRTAKVGAGLGGFGASAGVTLVSFVIA